MSNDDEQPRTRSDAPPPPISLPPLAAPRRTQLPIAEDDTPEVVPARMINELLYCERLLYLEWAQAEFEDNLFTVDGRLVHTRVDARAGVLPPPSDDDEEDEDPPPFEVRSVWLTSERLGITAKIDLVEGEGGLVSPVEYKRGKVPAAPEGAYLPERAQLCAQVLLLREHGYRCEGGEIWYAGERRRVPIRIDAALEKITLDAVRHARRVVASGRIPPPLEDSPKCKGCSLVAVCLPDEVTLLRRLAAEDEEVDEPAPVEQLGLDLAPEPTLPAFESDAFGPMTKDPWGIGDTAKSEHEIRRLHPARHERLPLYVQAQGARIALDGHTLRVEAKGAAPVIAKLPLTSQVVVMGQVQVTTAALAALLDHDVPLTLFSSGGWYRGRTMGHGSKNVELRIAQYRTADDAERSLAIARTFVAAKVRNQRTLLRRNGSADEVLLGELEILARKAEHATSAGELLGLEGTAARGYFGAFGTMLKAKALADGFALEGRNRRPPKDPVNALLSFTYALLVKDVSLACTTAGFDPLLGFFHRPRYGRPALALDLMEEMRPLIADSTVVGALNTGVVGEDDFETSPAGVALRAPGRKRLLAAYERRMEQLVTHPVFGYRVTYRRVLEVQARLLARHVMGEIGRYPAFRTR